MFSVLQSPADTLYIVDTKIPIKHYTDNVGLQQYKHWRQACRPVHAKKSRGSVPQREGGGSLHFRGQDKVLLVDDANVRQRFARVKVYGLGC
jgi:hypothetical protein